MASEITFRFSSIAQEEGHPVKPNLACICCKTKKVKCYFDPGMSTCTRCQDRKFECKLRSRKKREPALSQEQLEKISRKQDLDIEDILCKIDKQIADQRNLNRNLTLLRVEPASLASSNAMTSKESIQKWMRPGSARPFYYSKLKGQTNIGLNLKESLSPPDIVTQCELFAEEIEHLFKLFFERINSFFSILDDDLHTPENLIWDCPFLFTVICAVASRFYKERPSLHLFAVDFAREAAARALFDGDKSVDVCQAYLLMSVYPVPRKKWADDRSWLLMGVAIRMALELKLDEPPPGNFTEQEARNRTRTWLNCYCVDGSHAIQFGKIPMLRLDDYLARNSGEWYKSPHNSPYDVHLCAYVQIIIIIAKWRSQTTKNTQLNLIQSVLKTEEKLSKEMTRWDLKYEEDFKRHPREICRYRGNTTRMITAYLRLVVLAVGFQHAVKIGPLSSDSELVYKSIDVARKVIQIMVKDLHPTGHLKFAMAAHFLYVSFAAAFLINLLRTTLVHLLNDHIRTKIIKELNDLITIMKDVAVDDRHTPALYSRFLSTLLTKHTYTQPIDKELPDQPNFRGVYGEEYQHQHTLQDDLMNSNCGAYHGQWGQWPDLPPGVGENYYPSSNQPDNASLNQQFQQPHTSMDFSLNHFRQATTYHAFDRHGDPNANVAYTHLPTPFFQGVYNYRTQ